jgi:hypothetical protein
MRKPLAIAVLAVGALTLQAGELQLVDGASPFRLGWRQEQFTASPPKKLTAEPAYKSDRVQYLALLLGNGKDQVITCALDESQGPGKGYDTLYLDANNNGDLTDDPAIKLRIECAGPATLLDVEPLILVRYADGTQRKLRVKLEIRGQQDRGARYASLSAGYQVDQHLEGKVDIGDRKNVLIGIYNIFRDQHEASGCFDDYCVDRLRIDLDGDDKLDAKTEDFPLSKVISVDGKLWQVDLKNAGFNLDIKPCSLPTGKIGVNFNLAKNARVVGGAVEILNDDGYGFKYELPFKDGFVVPEGAYRISNAHIVLADGAGKKWGALFSLPNSLIVKHADSTVVTLGGPLKMGLTCHEGPGPNGVVFKLTPGGRACMEPLLTGAAGEVYENIALLGTRMAPSVKVIDADNTVLVENKMDYG